MKQTFLGAPPDEIKKQIRARVILGVSALLIAAAVNIALTLLRTPENHTAFLIINIVLDLIVGWFCVYLLDSHVLPNRRLLRLYGERGTKLSGTVDSVSENTERYSGFDCLVITIGDQKVFVINNGNLKLEPGQDVTVDAVHGIVKEVIS